MSLVLRTSELPDWREAGLLCLDLETCDPNLIAHGPGDVRGDGFIAGVGLAADDEEPVYVPLAHEQGDNAEREPVTRWLRDQLEHRERRERPVTGANLNYDRGWLYADLGIDTLGVPNHDVQIAEPLIDETQSSYSLGAIAERRGYGGKDEEELYAWLAATFGGRATRKRQGGRIWRAPAEVVHDYVMSDLKLPIAILREQYEELERKRLWDAFEREVVVSDIVLAMRRRGVRVDAEHASREVERLQREIDDTVRELGLESLWSPEDVAGLCRHHGLEPPRTPKSGQPSVTKSYLEGLEAEGHGFATRVLRARKLDHNVGTFIRGYILGNVAPDGRVHGQFHQLRGDDEDRGMQGTITGRFCVAGDTLIETQRGQVRIDELKPEDGYTVPSHTGRWNRVLRRIYKGEEEMVRVDFADGSSVESTRAHRVLTFGGWRQVGTLEPGEEIVRHERIQDEASRPQDQQVGCGYVPGGRQADPEGDCGANRGPRKHGSSHPETRRGPRAIEAGEEPTVLEVEDGPPQPDAKQAREGSPQSCGAVPEQGGLRNGAEARLVPGERDAEPGQGTPGGGLSDAGVEQAPGGDARPPHRRGPDQQRPVESGDSNRARSSEAPRTITVEAVYPVGALSVWDLEVERDHSYAAAGVFHHNSSSDPNLQNLPSRDPEMGPLCRGMFLPDEGEEWLSDDYAQIEPRLTLHYARGPQAERMREAYRGDPSIDCYDTLIEELSGEGLGRKPVKNIWLGLLYSMGLNKLCLDLGVDDERGKELIGIFDEAAPYVKRLKKDVENAAKRRGWIRTLGGRLMHFPFWEPADFQLKFARDEAGERLFPPTRDRQEMSRWLREAGYPPRTTRAYAHKALNKLIQPGAADVMKDSMVDLWRSGVCDVLGAPLVTVHDELGWSKPRTREGDEAAAEVRHRMENPPSFELALPLRVDEERGPDWGHLEEAA